MWDTAGTPTVETTQGYYSTLEGTSVKIVGVRFSWVPS